MKNSIIKLGALGIASMLLSINVDAADVEINFTEYTLDNGLRLVVHEDNKAPIVAVNVWYHVGSKNEKRGKTGFAHLFEHLMFNGTENYDDEYFKPFELVGATNMNGTTNFDRTNYFQNVPKTALDMTLWMESERMGHLLGAITQEKLDAQRGVVQNEKRQGDNQPYGKVLYSILAGIYPEGHPYATSIIGSMEDLDAATLDDVHEWFKTYYGPNNAVIVVAGDVVPEEVRKKVELYFGDIPPGPPIAKKEKWVVKLDRDKREVMQDRVPQARLYKIWGGPSLTEADNDLLNLAGDVLATGKNSRLFERLVYKDQIATTAQAGMFNIEIGGLFFSSVTVQPGGDLKEVENALNEEIERLLKDGVTEEELERVKTQRRSAFVRGLESIGGFGGKSDLLAMNAVYEGDPGAYRKSMDRLEAATAEEVTAAARRWLTAGAYHLEVHPFPDAAAAAEGADRSSVPETNTFPEVKFAEFERDFLTNGMELIVANRSAVPVVNIRMSLDAGFASDQFGELGTSSLAMTMLDEGTTSRSALEISDELARLGARFNAGSGIDSSTVGISAMKENLDASLDIFADLVLNPAFPEAELERLRKMRIAQIQQEKTRPVGLAYRIFPKLLYGEGHAYSMPLTGSGTEESVNRISRDSLVDYHDTWFRPNNATMIVVGDTSMAEIKPKLERLFRKWEPGKTPTKNITDVGLRDTEQVYVIDRPGSEQSIIFAGNIAPAVGDGNELAIEMMNEIIGGSFTSRINMNLREDKAWAYGARTMMLSTKGQRPFIAYAPVQTDKTMESMAEIRRELTEYLGDNPATDEEINKVKSNNTLSLPGRWETAAAVLRDIGEIVTYDLPDDYWDTYAESVRNVSAGQITAAADAVIKPENMIWVIVGDREKIEPRIRELELGEITLLDVDGNELPPTALN
ncbi:Peptidase M16 domain protein [uncultured Woeseiaceae bacterium]|uniref:Peptidase M16 domain protein n=1 Tax=uncultured Woeseiaceae bacterium TaxID=1983305 RepID=A0A7D9D307_9GAMM|nr:Peptidase M16 domain protein [uncultured Woeseiaceae bacterium]